MIVGRFMVSCVPVLRSIDRFDKGTADGHLKYIGYKSDMNKLSLCIHFGGNHYDALLTFSNNPR